MGYDDQVHMIGHETVAQQRKFVQPKLGSQQVEVDETLVVGIQDRAAGIAALGYVVWYGYWNDTRETRHPCTVSESRAEPKRSRK